MFPVFLCVQKYFAATVVVYLEARSDVDSFACISGTQAGSIVPPRGHNKFGWDPIFLPEGSDKTYAEMEKVEKNKVSHRYKALMKLDAYIREHYS